MAPTGTSVCAQLPAPLEGVVDELLLASLSPSTRQQYATEFKRFAEMFYTHMSGFLPRRGRWWVTLLICIHRDMPLQQCKHLCRLCLSSTRWQVSKMPRFRRTSRNSFYVRSAFALLLKDMHSPVTVTMLKKMMDNVAPVVDDHYTCSRFKSLSYFALFRVSEMVGKQAGHFRCCSLWSQPNTPSLGVEWLLQSRDIEKTSQFVLSDCSGNISNLGVQVQSPVYSTLPGWFNSLMGQRFN